MAASEVLNNFQRTQSCPPNTSMASTAPTSSFTPVDSSTAANTASVTSTAAQALFRGSQSLLNLLGLRASKSNFVPVSSSVPTPAKQAMVDEHLYNNSFLTSDQTETERYFDSKSDLTGSFHEKKSKELLMENPGKSAYIGRLMVKTSNEKVMKYPPGSKFADKPAFIRDFTGKGLPPLRPKGVPLSGSSLLSSAEGAVDFPESNDQVSYHNTMNTMAGVSRSGVRGGGPPSYSPQQQHVLSSQQRHGLSPPQHHQPSPPLLSLTTTGDHTLPAHASPYPPHSAGRVSVLPPARASSSSVGQYLSLIKGAFRSIGQPATTWICPEYLSGSSPVKPPDCTTAMPSHPPPFPYQEYCGPVYQSYQSYGNYCSTQQYSDCCDVDPELFYFPSYMAEPPDPATLCSWSSSGGGFATQQRQEISSQLCRAQEEHFLMEQKQRYLHYEKLHQQKQHNAMESLQARDVVEESNIDKSWFVVSNDARSLPSVSLNSVLREITPTAPVSNCLVMPGVADALRDSALPALSLLKVDVTSGGVVEQHPQEYNPTDGNCLKEDKMLEDKSSGVESYELFYSESSEFQVEDGFNYHYSDEFNMSCMQPFNSNNSNDENYSQFCDKSFSLLPNADVSSGCYQMSNSVPLNPYAKEWTSNNCMSSKLNPEAKEWVPKTESDDKPLILEQHDSPTVTERAIIIEGLQDDNVEQNNSEKQMKNTDSIIDDVSVPSKHDSEDIKCKKIEDEDVESLSDSTSDPNCEKITQSDKEVKFNSSESCVNENIKYLSPGCEALPSRQTDAAAITSTCSVVPANTNFDNNNDTDNGLNERLNDYGTGGSVLLDESKYIDLLAGEKELNSSDVCAEDYDSDDSLIISFTFSDNEDCCGVNAAGRERYKDQYDSDDDESSASEDSDGSIPEYSDDDDSDDGIMFCVDFDDECDGVNGSSCAPKQLITDSMCSDKRDTKACHLGSLLPCLLFQQQQCHDKHGANEKTDKREEVKKGKPTVNDSEESEVDDWDSASDRSDGCISAKDWAFGVSLMKNNSSIKIQTQMLIYVEKERKNSLTDADKANLSWNAHIDEDVLGSSGAKVRFHDTVSVFPVDKNVDREGEWEMMARDRMRFKSRTENLNGVLRCVLQDDHRKRVYDERFNNNEERFATGNEMCKKKLPSDCDNSEKISTISAPDIDFNNSQGNSNENVTVNDSGYVDKSVDTSECSKQMTECIPVSFVLGVSVTVIGGGACHMDKAGSENNYVNSCKPSMATSSGVLLEKKAICVDNPR